MALLIAAPLFSQLITGFRNRSSRTEKTAKGWMLMTKVMELASLTMHNIGCGLAGGFLGQAKGHSASTAAGVFSQAPELGNDMTTACPVERIHLRAGHNTQNGIMAIASLI